VSVRQTTTHDEDDDGDDDDDDDDDVAVVYGTCFLLTDYATSIGMLSESRQTITHDDDDDDVVVVVDVVYGTCDNLSIVCSIVCSIL